MPRDITVTLYKFDELPTERAKERARDWWRSDPESCWPWSDDWWQSAQEFAKIAPVDIESADWDRAHVSVKWSGDCDVAELSGLRAWKWLHNNGWFDLTERNAQGECTLTGYFGDCPLFDPMMEYQNNPIATPDLKQLFYDCAQAWIRAAQEDMMHCYSDGAVDDAMIMNEHEFTESGAIA